MVPKSRPTTYLLIFLRELRLSRRDLDLASDILAQLNRVSAVIAVQRQGVESFKEVQLMC